jgi:DNA polymerase-3 subunit alpha
VDLRRIGKRPLEVLARAGAFDVLDGNRRRVLESLDALVAWSQAVQEQKASAQVSLFGEVGDDLPEPRLAQVPDWPAPERLAEEFKAVGFYLSGHPLDDYLPALRRRQVMTLDEITTRAVQGPLVGRIAGTVALRQERKSARGNRFAFVTLSDPTGQYEVTVFSDVLDQARALLEPGTQVVLQVEATAEGEQMKLLVRGVTPVDAVVADAGAVGLRIFFDDAAAVGAVAAVLEGALRDGVPGGRGPVRFCPLAPDIAGDVEIDCGREYPVTPQIRGALRSLPGVVEVVEI